MNADLRAPWPRRIARLCFYLAVALLLIPCLFLPPHSPDLWLHLKTGEWILQHGVPHVDPFSYTRAGQPWIDHEWLFQLIVYPLWRCAGDVGLTILWMAVLLALILCVARLCLRTLPPLTALAVVGVTMSLTNIRGALSPELFSLLYFLSTCRLLEARRRQPRWLWGLVPLQALWVNTHGFAVIGWVVSAWVLLGEWLLLRYPLRWWGAEGADRPMTRRLGLIVLAQTATLLLTPYGWQSLRYPLTVIGSLCSGGPQFVGFVEELMSFATTGSWPEFAGFALLLLVGAGSFLTRRHRLDVGLLAPFLVSALAAGWIIRQVGFFALMATCAIAWNLAGPLGERSRRVAWYLMTVTALGLAGSLWWASLLLRAGRAPERISTAAVDYLAAHALPGEVFNTFNYGAYMIFRCAPQRRVFIDGRTEFYGPRFMQEEFTAAALDAAVWQRSVERYHIRTALLGRDEREGRFLARRLYREAPWRIAYVDDKALVMVYAPNAPQSTSRAAQAQQWLTSLPALVDFLWEMGDVQGVLQHLTEQLTAHPNDAEIRIELGLVYYLLARSRLGRARPLTHDALAAGGALLAQARSYVEAGEPLAGADRARAARLLAEIRRVETWLIEQQQDR